MITTVQNNLVVIVINDMYMFDWYYVEGTSSILIFITSISIWIQVKQTVNTDREEYDKERRNESHELLLSI